MHMVSKIGLAAAALAVAGFAPTSGQLRVYNISGLNASVSVDGGPESALGNSEFSNYVVKTGRHIISVRRRGTLKVSITLTADNAYHSPKSGDHWCVRASNNTTDLLPVANCEQLVDFGG